MQFNILAPDKTGITLSCTIPPDTITNNSAVFGDYPPEVVAINKRFGIDHAATDADGDSLSYELCTAQSGGSDAVIKPTVPGIFVYTITGYKDSLCSGSDEVVVEVKEFSGYTVSSAFTPNGDGVNDELVPYPVGNSTLKRFKIYNRWGNLVYSAGPQDPGWNGIYGGKEQDMGVFYWQLEFTDNNGTVRFTTGDVTLIR